LENIPDSPQMSADTTPLVISKTRIKLVFFVPLVDVERVKTAIGEAGAGRIERYDFCSYSLHGFGSWRALDGANPTVGQIGEHMRDVAEVRLETSCHPNEARRIIDIAKGSCSYETMGVDIYNLLEFE
jgi:hypothetical protein